MTTQSFDRQDRRDAYSHASSRNDKIAVNGDASCLHTLAHDTVWQIIISFMVGHPAASIVGGIEAPLSAVIAYWSLQTVAIFTV